MVKCRSHHDADGLVSGYFASFGIKGAEIEIWNGSFGDTSGLQEGDWMLDMKPNKDLKNLNVIDHHHPYPENRSYNLVSSTPDPTSYQCWLYWKDKIPKEQWWKVVIGLVGDGQAQLIPYEIFKQCPKLLVSWSTSRFDRSGKLNIALFPVYKLVSSGVNALLRDSRMEDAMNVLRFADNPIDVIENPMVKQAKAKTNSEFENIRRTCRIYDLNDLSVVLYNSSMRMSGFVAIKVQEILGKTVMAINMENGRGSLRGDLALYIKEKLKPIDYLLVDGHPGFMGASISVLDEQNFVDDLIRILG